MKILRWMGAGGDEAAVELDGAIGEAEIAAVVTDDGQGLALGFELGP